MHEITGEIEAEMQDTSIGAQQIQITSNDDTLPLLETRRDMYAKALEAAKTTGDGAKARRLERQFKVV